MGLSAGTRAPGTPLLMLPPGTEPRVVPGRREARGAEGCQTQPGPYSHAPLPAGSGGSAPSRPRPPRTEGQLLGPRGPGLRPPQASPRSTDVSWAVGTPRLSGGPAWPRGDSCSCFTPLKGAEGGESSEPGAPETGPLPADLGAGPPTTGTSRAAPEPQPESTGRAVPRPPPGTAAGPGAPSGWRGPDPHPASWGPWRGPAPWRGGPRGPWRAPSTGCAAAPTGPAGAEVTGSQGPEVPPRRPRPAGAPSRTPSSRGPTGGLEITEPREAGAGVPAPVPQRAAGHSHGLPRGWLHGGGRAGRADSPFDLPFPRGPSRRPRSGQRARSGRRAELPPGVTACGPGRLSGRSQHSREQTARPHPDVPGPPRAAPTCRSSTPGCLVEEMRGGGLEMGGGRGRPGRAASCRPRASG